MSETYTIRPEGSTAWAEDVAARDVERVREEAISQGLTRVLVVRDSDGKVLSFDEIMRLSCTRP